MIAAAIPLVIVSIGVLCWLLYSFAVYALPCFVGLFAVFTAHQSGAGTGNAMILGLASGVFVLAIGRIAGVALRSPLSQVLLRLTFAGPAALAGYYATVGLCALALPADGIWRHAFGLLGAVAVGTTAWLRFAPISGNALEPRAGDQA